MSYVDRNLMPDETVVSRTKLHWIRYFWSAAWMALGLYLAARAALAVPGHGVQFGVLAAFSLFIGTVLGVRAVVDVLTSEFVVTNRRVVLKRGFLRRRMVELLLPKIESMHVEQGIVGRVCGFGTIAPGGSGGTVQVFDGIAGPLEFRQQVNQQIEAVETDHV